MFVVFVRPVLRLIMLFLFLPKIMISPCFKLMGGSDRGGGAKYCLFISTLKGAGRVNGERGEKDGESKREKARRGRERAC